MMHRQKKLFNHQTARLLISFLQLVCLISTVQDLLLLVLVLVSLHYRFLRVILQSYHVFQPNYLGILLLLAPNIYQNMDRLIQTNYNYNLTHQQSQLLLFNQFVQMTQELRFFWSIVLLFLIVGLFVSDNLFQLLVLLLGGMRCYFLL